MPLLLLDLDNTLADREAAFQALCARPNPPGVLGYDDGEPVGWCSIGPRAENTRLSRSRLIRPLDDLPVWNVFCVRVRPGFRGRGITGQLIEGAVAFAAEHGAPAVEAIPVDNDGAKVDLTMAFVGTRAMFEAAGFTKVADTRSVTAGLPRVVMRRSL